MGMTNKQFKSLLRLVKFVTNLINKYVPDNEKANIEKDVDEMVQSMLED